MPAKPRPSRDQRRCVAAACALLPPDSPMGAQPRDDNSRRLVSRPRRSLAPQRIAPPLAMTGLDGASPRPGRNNGASNMKRLMVLMLATALVWGVAGSAVAGEGTSFFFSKVPILTASLIPASGGMATGGGAVLVITSKGQVLLRVRSLSGAGGPITNTGSLEIELLVNGAAVPT